MLTSLSCQELAVSTELDLGTLGGAETFFADLDGDGRQEIVAYQGPAVFGASSLSQNAQTKAFLPDTTCVSAFTADGRHLWTWGEPYAGKGPYVSHAYESCLAFADLDGSGTLDVIVADGDVLHVLDGRTGQSKRSCALPQDDFYIVGAVGRTADPKAAAIVVKNGETGSGDWRYGEPVIGLTAELEIAWGPRVVTGGGHHIMVLDIDGDGELEYIIGYEALKTDGRRLWLAEAIDPETFDPYEMHVDYTDCSVVDCGWRLAMAGSDRLYCMDEAGRTIFEASAGHTQGSAIGAFRADSDLQVACYNSPDGPIRLYTTAGEQIWEHPTTRQWPLGQPACCEDRRFHRNRPLLRLDGVDGQRWLAYADGGWPWCLDGDGNESLTFHPPASSKVPEPAGNLPNFRGDDLGFGFAIKCLDIDGDGAMEAVIYNRRHVWIYRLDEVMA